MAKILLVEDDKLLAKMYEENLSREKYDIVTVDNAKDAQNTALSLHPDIMILDIMLPGGANGFDILRTFKHHDQLKHIPIIMLTNLDSEKETALQLGVNEYLVKVDNTPDQIVQAVKRNLKKKFGPF